ncbi:TPA: cobalt-precorrin-7 (C(5))-methyltransferase [Morganella morganii]|uniref:cobalt-precorrin-7 (C(5))-methyltransferase n=1 Tax=Morganella morganii TaxID=582 RepID=UPI0009235B2A|nr:cobalt-precorrin-7 (C(5))-methyltransferase [Morganella morganii]SGC67272.1 precorrin-6Y C5,15-methyltransferase [Mycobacterium tuberculosis]ELA7728250.1 cobalt-precorrin-7 (C(5))-methyltransferase [Morganella morganii]MBA5838506.1 cobalt-precorrin-7 (C(5))-methyltransferase [Morganella morganii]MBC3998966.1 cobalt-precorrin-7 (C(5))-methyltransferase [Morganella morganii]MBT0313401.1 cobalt-precorrin-7 (C(5))-methyltransferase [Morganella morganii subsp. morganii]
MIYVTGVGPGSEAYLTRRAADVISGADILIGGQRHLDEFAGLTTETRVIDADISGLMNWIAERLDRRIVILASGDPMFFGIGKRISETFAPEQVQIVPGISSVQYLCSRAGMDMNDIYLTSSHNRSPDFDWLLAHERIGMVTDSKIGPKEIAAEIRQRGQTRRMIIGENLSGRNERITILNADDVSRDYDMNVVLIDKQGSVA